MSVTPLDAARVNRTTIFHNHSVHCYDITLIEGRDYIKHDTIYDMVNRTRIRIEGRGYSTHDIFTWYDQQEGCNIIVDVYSYVYFYNHLRTNTNTTTRIEGENVGIMTLFIYRSNNTASEKRRESAKNEDLAQWKLKQFAALIASILSETNVFGAPDFRV